jgi:hypothetical protein
MLTELILGFISIVFVLFLVTMRYFSLAYAKGSSSMLSKSDSKIVSLWSWIKRFCRETGQDISELFKDLPHIVLHFFQKLFYKLYKRTKKLVDLIKGNRIQTDKGSVSLYLKKIENNSNKDK